MSKKNKLDQYYTKKEIADWCWSRVIEKFGLETSYIEPSAGEGVFLRDDVSIESFDLEPKHKDINTMDFFKLEECRLFGKVVIGNPPFGWASSLAVKFINKASKANAVCFILPKTFMKEVFQQRISPNLHLVGEWELPRNSFVLYGDDYDVPCCFQIWENKGFNRETLIISNYIKEDKEGCLFLRRVGGRAGKFVREDEFTESTTYRVSCSEGIKLKIEKLYPEIKRVASQTAGVRSITLKEINYILTKYS